MSSVSAEKGFPIVSKAVVTVIGPYQTVGENAKREARIMAWDSVYSTFDRAEVGPRGSRGGGPFWDVSR